MFWYFQRAWIYFTCIWTDADRGYSILYWQLKLRTIEVEWDFHGVIDKVWLIGNHVVHRCQYVRLTAISILQCFFLRGVRQNKVGSFCWIKRFAISTAQFILTLLSLHPSKKLKHKLMAIQRSRIRLHFFLNKET